MVIGLFIPLRRMERWLHQHVFKVGWLLTRNHQTTTILYYTFFLPGIVLHEVTYWLVAGVLNVRAQSSITWPEAQDIAALRLNFIHLERRVSPLKVAIIHLVPSLAGLAAVSLIAHNILDVREIVATLSGGYLQNVSAAFRQLTSTPDFWLWIYIAFTIGNTMMPDFAKLRGLRIVFIITGVISALLFLLGLGNATVVRALGGPVADGLYTVAGLFAIIIGIDLVIVTGLGVTESLIERVTGHSATFKNNRLVTMTRGEMREQRARQQRRSRRRAGRGESGPPSVYKLPLPIPGPPGEEPVTHPAIIVEAQEPRPTPRPRREQPALIAGSARGEPAAGRAAPPGGTPRLPPSPDGGRDAQPPEDVYGARHQDADDRL